MDPERRLEIEATDLQISALRSELSRRNPDTKDNLDSDSSHAPPFSPAVSQTTLLPRHHISQKDGVAGSLTAAVIASRLSGGVAC